MLPPLYEKKVGRPTKNRRKEPVELEGTSETKMSKHGMQMTCSYCGDQGHNRAGCQLRKSGIRPKLQPVRKTMEEPHEEDPTQQMDDNLDEDPVITQVVWTDQIFYS